MNVGDSTEPLHPLQLWHSAWLGANATVARFADPLEPQKSRCRFEGDNAQLPQSWLNDETTLARAALAHIAAHRRFGSAHFDPGRLRPVQIALVALFEDARVEQLSIAERPGLRRLWQPFINSSDGTTTTDLLTRLAWALFDPAHVDSHHWVAKGQQLFFLQQKRWSEPSLSRELGSVLGNDLGQMRLQFNWKSYAVAQRYRDDGHGLWQFPEAEEPARELISLGGTGASQPQTLADQKNGSETQQPETLVEPAQWYQPEWDYRIGRLRPDWVTLRHEISQRGDATALREWLWQQRLALQQLRRALAQREASLRRQPRQPSGDEPDLDAAIGAAIDLRRGALPDHRLYRSRCRTEQPRTLLLLLDASQSSADRIANGQLSVLDIERRAAALMAEAGAQRGDRIALLAFRSNGRSDVRLQLLQPFEAKNSSARLERLAGLQSGLSTRLGAALRASLPLFGRERLAGGGWLIAVSDGEPSDIDSSDSRYLIEDARRAVGELRRYGIRCTALGLDPNQQPTLEKIFGARFTRSLTRVEQLPQQLQQLYRLLR